MDEFVYLMIFYFLILIVPPIILFVIIIQLKRQIRTLSDQFSLFSRKMENLLRETKETDQEITTISHTVSSPAPDIVIPPIPGEGSHSTQKEKPIPEKQPEPVYEETFVWVPDGVKEEEPEQIVEKVCPPLPPSVSRQKKEETLFFDIHTTNAHTDGIRTASKERKKEKEGVFSSQFWGENLLSKIGIITFVLGIAFFVKYAIDQDWINEIGRVGIGLLTAVSILGVAHKLRKQYDVFSSILAGGGFAVFYITITLAFREYKLIPQPMAFVLLIMVTIACVVLSVFYDKKELALFSLLGGFAAPFLVSTGTGSYVVLFSYILILNTGMIWLAFRKNWNLIGITCFVLSQLVIWTWLLSNFTHEYGSVVFFLLLFFIQFHILAVADHLKKRGTLSRLQAIILLVNNLSLFGGGIYIFRSFPTQLNGLITIGLAVLNAIALILIFRDKRADSRMKYLLIATIMTFITIAIPLQLEGRTISLIWSAEMVVILVLWLRSDMKIFRIGLYTIMALVVCSYIKDIETLYDYAETLSVMPLFFNSYFITGITLTLACIVSAWLLRKELRKERPASQADVHTNQLKTLFNLFFVAVYVVLFVTLFIELDHQLSDRLRYMASDSLRISTIITYVFVYISLVVYLNRRKLEHFSYAPGILLTILGLYAMSYYYLKDLREKIYLISYSPAYDTDGLVSFHAIPPSSFYIHLLAFVAIGYIAWQTWQYSCKKEFEWRTGYVWILVILSIVIITQESNNLAIMLAGNNSNYYNALNDMQTFGYPILWGILAMCLMIWGLKTKDLVLRKISLFFFAFIIGKFYLYDVWQMSQGGRIVSFVVLGLILLLVSFMQQRIRKLMKEEDKQKPEDV